MPLTRPRLLLRQRQMEDLWSARNTDGRWAVLERAMDELLQDQPQPQPNVIVLKERLRQRAARRAARGVKA